MFWSDRSHHPLTLDKNQKPLAKDKTKRPADAVAKSENMLPIAIHIKPYLRRVGDRLDNRGAAKAVPKMTEPSWISMMMLESSNHSILATIRYLN